MNMNSLSPIKLKRSNAILPDTVGPVDFENFENLFVINNDEIEEMDVDSISMATEVVKNVSKVSREEEQNISSLDTAVRVWWGVVIGWNVAFSEFSIISIFSQICKKYVFQLEKSDDGFVHWQCCIALKQKTTKNNLLKKLEDFHIPTNFNVQIKNCKENFTVYCSKSETRQDGPWSKGIKGISPEPVRTIRRSDFYPWQEEVVKMVEDQPDDRSIYWYYDIQGCKGKTSLAKWLAVNKEAFIFKGGSNDMANRIISEGAPKLACMNLSRTQENYVSYQTIEDIKDGLIVSSKYEGGQLVFNSPHVIIFANFRPDETKLSQDRWVIKCLDPDDSMDNCVAHFIYA